MQRYGILMTETMGVVFISQNTCPEESAATTSALGAATTLESQIGEVEVRSRHTHPCAILTICNHRQGNSSCSREDRFTVRNFRGNLRTVFLTTSLCLTTTTTLQFQLCFQRKVLLCWRQKQKPTQTANTRSGRL